MAMHTLIFKRENNDFSDILSEKSLKRKIYAKMHWNGYLFLRVNCEEDTLMFFKIKYSELVDVNSVIYDFSPIRGVDYETYDYINKVR